MYKLISTFFLQIDYFTPTPYFLNLSLSKNHPFTGTCIASSINLFQLLGTTQFYPILASSSGYNFFFCWITSYPTFYHNLVSFYIPLFPQILLCSLITTCWNQIGCSKFARCINFTTYGSSPAKNFVFNIFIRNFTSM